MILVYLTKRQRMGRSFAALQLGQEQTRLWLLKFARRKHGGGHNEPAYSGSITKPPAEVYELQHHCSALQLQTTDRKLRVKKKNVLDTQGWIAGGYR